MGFPTVKKFLCCISLETGGLVIGWLNIVLCTITLILLFGVLIITSIGYGQLDSVSQEDSQAVFIGKKLESFIQVPEFLSKIILSVLIIVFSIVLIFDLMYFIGALLLVIGTKKVSLSLVSSQFY